MKIIRSSVQTQKFWEEREAEDSGTFERDLPTVAVDTAQKFQTHLGFGGALTESTGVALSYAGKEGRHKVLTDYYTPAGLNYNLGRISVHSSDFSLGNYTYVEEGDTTLSTFSTQRDEKYVLPLVREALGIRKIELLSSAWSPPGYMKTNGEMNYGGKLRRDRYALWAEYYVKFLLELKAKGIPVSMITAQNEPEASQLWDSCSFTAQEEADFLEHYLIPLLDKNGLSDVKILIWDHNRDRIVRRASVTLASEALRKRVWGIAYHWYVSNEHTNLTAAHALFPEKHILLTESGRAYAAEVYEVDEDEGTTTLSALYGPASTNDEYDTTAFEEDDIVMYSFAANEVQEIYAAEEMSGEVTRVRSNTNDG